jgi:hypothetical protein
MNNTNKRTKKISIKVELGLIALAGMILCLLYYLILPGIPSWEFFTIGLVSLSPSIIIGIIWSVHATEESYDLIYLNSIFPTSACVILLLTMGVIGFVGSPLFHADDYANSIKVKEMELTENALPSIDDIHHISLMDTDSAKELGKRTLGELPEYVNQYIVSEQYATISYTGKTYKVAPLEHSNVFTALKNDTIPGYILIDTVTSETQFIEVENGIKYSPSACFGKDLRRQIRKFYNDKLDKYYNFQLDENGTPYFVLTTLEYKVAMSAAIPSGAITVNAVTGDVQKYSLEQLPEWVDQVFNGDIVSKLYNRHGKNINGAINISNEGKTRTSDDYGYIEKNNSIYIYTGITSVSASDKSIMGFIVANSRTGECCYYKVDGAGEKSAMGTANGEVANYGYTASYPTLVLYEGTPTYVMVLKDSNGLVKKYAMVNMKNYNVVVAENSLEMCKKAYLKKLNDVATTDPKSQTEETITVKNIEFVTVNGETIVYVKDTNNRVFKESFADNENLILIEIGQTVNVKYHTLFDITSAEIHHH